MPLHTRDQLLRQLHAHSPADPTEGAALAGLVDLLETHPDPFARTTYDPGHITASALLLNPKRTHLAFIWHAKLGRHLEPGGHCEPQDHTTADASLRELLEETEVQPHHVRRVSDTPTDIDVHTIPPHGSEGPHQHYDIRYTYHLTHDTHLPLVTWRPLSELQSDEDASMRRCARKLVRLGAQFGTVGV